MTFKEDKKWISNSILAGVMISIGSLVYLKSPNKTVGAFLFSIGLIAVILFKLSLFTGKVGYGRKIGHIPYLLAVLGLNIVGVIPLSFLDFPNVEQIVMEKLQTPYLDLFLKSVVCGILIYVSVENKENLIVTIIAIPAFILSGAEHCIADACFIFAAKEFTLNAILFLLIVVLGNSVGAIVFSILTKKSTEKE